MIKIDTYIWIAHLFPCFSEISLRNPCWYSTVALPCLPSGSRNQTSCKECYYASLVSRLIRVPGKPGYQEFRWPVISWLQARYLHCALHGGSSRCGFRLSLLLWRESAGFTPIKQVNWHLSGKHSNSSHSIVASRCFKAYIRWVLCASNVPQNTSLDMTCKPLEISNNC